MSNGKATIIFLIVELIKKILLYKMNYFPKPNTSNKNKIKDELDLSNYETKSNLKNATGIDQLKFAKKANKLHWHLDIDTLQKVLSITLNSLKSKVDKLDVEKLIPVPSNLSKLSNVVKNEVIKKSVWRIDEKS